MSEIVTIMPGRHHGLLYHLFPAIIGTAIAALALIGVALATTPNGPSADFVQPPIEEARYMEPSGPTPTDHPGEMDAAS